MRFIKPVRSRRSGFEKTHFIEPVRGPYSDLKKRAALRWRDFRRKATGARIYGPERIYLAATLNSTFRPKIICFWNLQFTWQLLLKTKTSQSRGHNTNYNPSGGKRK